MSKSLFGFGNKKQEQLEQIKREQAYRDFDNLKFSSYFDKTCENKSYIDMANNGITERNFQDSRFATGGEDENQAKLVRNAYANEMLNDPVLRENFVKQRMEGKDSIILSARFEGEITGEGLRAGNAKLAATTQGYAPVEMGTTDGVQMIIKNGMNGWDISDMRPDMYSPGFTKDVGLSDKISLAQTVEHTENSYRIEGNDVAPGFRAMSRARFDQNINHNGASNFIYDNNNDTFKMSFYNKDNPGKIDYMVSSVLHKDTSFGSNVIIQQNVNGVMKTIAPTEIDASEGSGKNYQATNLMEAEGLVPGNVLNCAKGMDTYASKAHNEYVDEKLHGMNHFVAGKETSLNSVKFVESKAYGNPEIIKAMQKAENIPDAPQNDGEYGWRCK